MVARLSWLLVWAPIALGAMPRSASARTITVRQDGTGDATTFQGGLDLISLPGDTLDVGPGFYDETAFFQPASPQEYAKIVCPAGPQLTRLRSLDLGRTGAPSSVARSGDLRRGSALFIPAEFSGLGIAQMVYQPSGHIPNWVNCHFEGGYRIALDGDYVPSFKNCEFSGRVEFLHVSGFVQDCRFTGVRVTIANGDFDGWITLRRCTFEGPSDTSLVIVGIGAGNAVSVERCRFSHGSTGVAIRPSQCDSYGAEISRCTFEDMTGAAITSVTDSSRYSPNAATYCGGGGPPIVIDSSRVTRCGAAVRVSPGFPPVRVCMVQDTLISTGGDAVVIERAPACLNGMSVLGSAGSGIVVSGGSLCLDSSRVADNSGDGVVLCDTLSTGSDVSGCSISGNGGAGLRFRANHVAFNENTISGNGGAGVAVTAVGDGVCTLLRNTSALNGGPGFILGAATASGPLQAQVGNNIAAFNAGVGIAATSAYSGAIAHNDSWRDGGGPYAGLSPAEQNLTRDPRFCDALCDDFHLQAGSPCADGGPYSQIGAFGVGCAYSPMAIEVLPGFSGRLQGKSFRHVSAVAILGSRVLEAADVEPSTVAFLGSSPRRPNGSDKQYRLVDVNHDGRLDLLLHLDSDDVPEPAGGDTLTLVAKTYDGAQLRGQTAVRPRRSAREEVALGGLRPLSADEAQAPRLALEAASPQVLGRGLMVAFELPSLGEATLELFDIGGRRLARDEVSSYGVGRHTVDVVAGRRVAAGLYFVRLTQGSVVLNARVAVLD